MILTFRGTVFLNLLAPRNDVKNTLKNNGLNLQNKYAHGLTTCWHILVKYGSDYHACRSEQACFYFYLTFPVHWQTGFMLTTLQAPCFYRLRDLLPKKVSLQGGRWGTIETYGEICIRPPNRISRIHVFWNFFKRIMQTCCPTCFEGRYPYPIIHRLTLSQMDHQSIISCSSSHFLKALAIDFLSFVFHTSM